MIEIVIATKNRGKISEIMEIISVEKVRLVDLHQLSFSGTIEERGKTFKENALVKAEAVYERYGIPAIADDSGLCVAYLDGKPGVRSARFAGPDASDEENNRLLMKKLQGVPWSERGAWFMCSAVFYYGPATYYVTEGRVNGIITEKCEGEGGFGYDPFFYLPSLRKTMAQLEKAEKNRISHRALAFRALRKHIEEYVADIATR